ncbi:MAG: permease [Fretibacterium sp.]|nr:permease [Fretibacterium sp.]
MIQREAIYLWYYFTVQFDQIFAYWVWGMAVGSFVSVFCKERILRFFAAMQGKYGLFGIVPACLLGIASPLCLYGTIPVAASFSEKGMRDDWLASFMMASILLNPQLIIYSAALGSVVLTVRVVLCFFCGVTAGLLVRVCCRGRPFFDFTGFHEGTSRDKDPNLLMRYVRNFGRNLRATGPWFLLGIFLSALFQLYVPAGSFERLFGRRNGFGVLMAATMGVPLYSCGGGTIPLLQQWLADGMSLGSASAFMITGPATKITNLGALKIVLGLKNFILYLLFVTGFSLLTGLTANTMMNTG